VTTDPDDAPGRGRLRFLLGAAGLLAVPVLVVWWPGCREYPPVTSRDALTQMKLLYSACNTKDVERLTRVELGAAKLAREGKLSPPEQEAFAHVIGLAKGGEWTDAEAAAFKFAQDQVGQGDPAAAADHHDHPAGKKKVPKGPAR
jgi:hypothetical protein